MKLFLIKNKEIYLDGPSRREPTRFGDFKATYRIDKEFSCDGKSGSDKQLCSALRRMNETVHQPTIDLSLFWNKEESGFLGLQLSEEGSFLKDVSALVGGDNVRVKATLYQLNNDEVHPPTNDPSITMWTKEMVVLHNSGKVCCEDMTCKVPDGWVEMLLGRQELWCGLTIEVMINHQLDNVQSELQPGQMVMRTMLHDEVHADVAIIPSNGSPIKCHKAVLSACSQVFDTMFQTDMLESKTSEIEMPDMTEDGVLSMLAYIYYQDLDAPNDDSAIAFELLRAADKYGDIPDLEKEMIKLLLSKPHDWFALDMAVQLFLFARKLDKYEILKIKIVGVLKRNVKRLKQVKEYKEIFSGKDPEAAMELNELFAISFITSGLVK